MISDQALRLPCLVVRSGQENGNDRLKPSGSSIDAWAGKRRLPLRVGGSIKGCSTKEPDDRTFQVSLSSRDPIEVRVLSTRRTIEAVQKGQEAREGRLIHRSLAEPFGLSFDLVIVGMSSRIVSTRQPRRWKHIEGDARWVDPVSADRIRRRSLMITSAGQIDRRVAFDLSTDLCTYSNAIGNRISKIAQNTRAT